MFMCRRETEDKRRGQGCVRPIKACGFRNDGRLGLAPTLSGLGVTDSISTRQQDWGGKASAHAGQRSRGSNRTLNGGGGEGQMLSGVRLVYVTKVHTNPGEGGGSSAAVLDHDVLHIAAVLPKAPEARFEDAKGGPRGA